MPFTNAAVAEHGNNVFDISRIPPVPESWLVYVGCQAGEPALMHIQPVQTSLQNPQEASTIEVPVDTVCQACEPAHMSGQEDPPRCAT